MLRKIYNDLLNWKKENIKMPYMLVGVRQTGKTYILQEFCKNEFENMLYINLDKNEQIQKIFEQTIDPEKIIKGMEVELSQSIDVDNTVIFLDEIQVSERAISSLKYFAESEKEYKIVSAGSLLGVKINRFKSSFPVGKVSIRYLYPMDFEEFLMAIEEDNLLKAIKESCNTMEPLLENVHNKALNLYKEYLCIGGMPSNILQYIQKGKTILSCDDTILEDIIIAYIADMSKYTQNTESIKIEKIYNSIPEQLGKEIKTFRYSIVDKGARKREYETSMQWLMSSNMILKCDNIKTPKSPLKIYKEGGCKVYLSDVGVLRVLSQITQKEILQDKNMIFKGVLAENYVAQVLHSKYNELYYWEQDSKYEVDFLINIDGDIIPVEVKAGDNVTSKSLNKYIKKYNPVYSIRISSKNFGFSNNIKSIPLYAISFIDL